MTLDVFEPTDLCACCSDLITLCADDHEHDGPIFRIGDIEWLCSPNCLSRYLIEDDARALEALSIGSTILATMQDRDDLDEDELAGLDSLTETVFHAAAQLKHESNMRIVAREAS